jgi:hypothetical protein
MLDPEHKQVPIHEVEGDDAEADIALWDAVEQLSNAYPVHIPFRLP